MFRGRGHRGNLVVKPRLKPIGPTASSNPRRQGTWRSDSAQFLAQSTQTPTKRPDQAEYSQNEEKMMQYDTRTRTVMLAALLLTAPIPARAEPPTCKMIATGGTIAMKIDPVKNAPVPAISGEDLLATVPEIANVAKIEVLNLSNVPSDYMDPDRWIGLHKAASEALERPEITGVVVSHGTDTLEESAWFLDLTVASPKPIVLIGAQRNASEKDFDGPRNLLNAARICTSPQAREKGSMIALNNQINAAREVTKSHTSDVETFRSGDYGFLGNTDYDRVVFYPPADSTFRSRLTSCRM
jgi:L-asparaginase/Glu-tRNA(Gln) amidotransferase subunit D